MDTASVVAPRKVDAGPSGFGGWLVLPLLGLIASPIMVAVATVRDVVPAFEASTWAALTTPGGPVYHAMWAPYLFAGVAMNATLFVAACCLIVIGGKKRRQFPTLMIWFYVFSVAVMLTEVLAVNTFLREVLPQEAQAMSHEVTRDFGRSLVIALIWGTYFRVSRRVSNTFVH